MTDSRPLRTVTVVGLGAMGGSVAKTVLRRAPHTPVFGVEPDRECAALARRDGVRVVDRLEDCDVDDGVVVFAAAARRNGGPSCAKRLRRGVAPPSQPTWRA